MLQEFGRIAALVRAFQQFLQPLVGFLVQVVDRFVAALVQPVRGHPGLGDLVHFTGANLDLDGRAKRTEQRGVQRLIAVRFRESRYNP